MEENHILACEFGLEIDYRWAFSPATSGPAVEKSQTVYLLNILG